MSFEKLIHIIKYIYVYDQYTLSSQFCFVFYYLRFNSFITIKNVCYYVKLF